MNEDRRDTIFVRFLAILLITNSHLDRLYPWPQLGTGGALGNALFFTLSGYGLTLSWARVKRPFPAWYSRRIWRIYPSLLPVVLLFPFVIDGGWAAWRWQDYLSGFFWPTAAWFVGALMLFYPVLFAILKSRRHSFFPILIGILFVPYFYLYTTGIDHTAYTIEGPGYFKWIFYLQAMLFGGFLAGDSRNIRPGTLRHLGVLSALLTGYFALLAFISQGSFGEWQAVIHLLTFPITYLVIRLSRSSFVLDTVMRPGGALSMIVTFVAALTLEIYLLQNRVYSHPLVLGLPFPLNIAVFSASVLVLAFLLARFADAVRFIAGGRSASGEV